MAQAAAEPQMIPWLASRFAVSEREKIGKGGLLLAHDVDGRVETVEKEHSDVSIGEWLGELFSVPPHRLWWRQRGPVHQRIPCP